MTKQFDTNRPVFKSSEINVDDFSIFKGKKGGRDDYTIRYKGLSVFNFEFEYAIATVRGAYTKVKGEQVKEDDKKNVTLQFGYEDNEELGMLIDAIDAKLASLFLEVGMKDTEVPQLYYIGRPKDEEVKNKFATKINERVTIKISKGGKLTKVKFNYDELLDTYALRDEKVYVTMRASIGYFYMTSSMRGLNLRADRVCIYPMVDPPSEDDDDEAEPAEPMDEDEDDDDRPARKRARVESDDE